MKRWLWLLLLLAGCSTHAPTANDLANARVRAGSSADAIALYKAALVADPANATIYLNAAQALRNIGQPEQAAAFLEQAILRGSPTQQAAAHYQLGNLHFDNQQMALAVAEYQAALRLHPTWEDARYNLELALALVGQPTPTPIEMQTNPDQAAVDTASPPTPIPGAGLPPTPSPTPETPGQGTPVAGGASPDNVPDARVTPNPLEGGRLDVEAARRLLTDLQFQRDNIGLPRQFETIPTPGGRRDW